MTDRGTIIQWNGDGNPASVGNIGFTCGGTGQRLKKLSGGQVTTYIGGDYEIADDGTVTKYLRGGKCRFPKRRDPSDLSFSKSFLSFVIISPPINPPPLAA